MTYNFENYPNTFCAIASEDNMRLRDARGCDRMSVYVGVHTDHLSLVLWHFSPKFSE